MELKELLKDTEANIIQKGNNQEITGIEIDSRKVKDGDAFIAITGSVTDGHNFILQAIKNGAKTIILEYVPESIKEIEDINIIQYPSTRDVAGLLAANFYHHPSDELITIGVTGTKGKTTVTNMIKEIIENTHQKCGIFGTLGIYYGDVVLTPHNTTPDPITIHKSMREMIEQGYSYLVMEASSQGFKQNRMNGMNFNVGVFLNIDRDHIGDKEHASFDEYLKCKEKIFDISEKVVVNSNDKIWNLLTPELKEKAITFSTDGEADYQATDISPFIENGIYGERFKVKTNGKTLEFKTRMPGEINVQNSLATLAALDQLNFKLEELKDAVFSFQSDGRTQILESAIPYNRTVFVDFAHNKLSIESVLNNLRAYQPKRLVSIFGLHWDETKMRRYDQGYAASKNSDLTILTEDHRGDEPFSSIKKDVIPGLEEGGGEYQIIENRRDAIIQGVKEIGDEDILVIFGMGNERTQRYGDKEVYFNEEEIVENFLKEENE